MHRPLFVGSLVVLASIALAARIPSSYLSRYCAESTRCLLSEMEGTIWDGSATLHVHNGTYWLAIPRLRWAFSMSGSLRLTTGNAEIGWAPGLDGWKLTANNLALDASIMGALLPQPLPRTGWEGVFSIPNLQWSCDWPYQACEGKGRAIWKQAGQQSLSGTLGNYQIELNATRGQSKIGLTVKGEEEGLGLSGNGRIDGASFEFDGEAWAMGADKDRIEAMLDAFGQRTASDRYRFRFSERFR